MNVLAPQPGTETPRAKLEQLARHVRGAGNTPLDLTIVSDAVDRLRAAPTPALEKAKLLRRMLNAGYPIMALAEAVGCSRSHIVTTARLLDLPPFVQKAIAAGKLSAAHGRCLFGCPDPEAVALDWIRSRISVREAEALSRGDKVAAEMLAQVRLARHTTRNQYAMAGESVVYFIQAAAGIGPIKIGTTRKLRLRLFALQGAHHEPLVVVGARPGGRQLEAVYHRRFASFHIRGEWYHPGPEIVAEAKRYSLGPKGEMPIVQRETIAAPDDDISRRFAAMSARLATAESTAQRNQDRPPLMACRRPPLGNIEDG